MIFCVPFGASNDNDDLFFGSSDIKQNLIFPKEMLKKEVKAKNIICHSNAEL